MFRAIMVEEISIASVTYSGPPGGYGGELFFKPLVSYLLIVSLG